MTTIEMPATKSGSLTTIWRDSADCGSGAYRVIFEYEMIDGQRTATCVFVGGRRWVYEVFQSRLGEM